MTSKSRQDPPIDHIIVGMGVEGSFLALALRLFQPARKFLMLECGLRLPSSLLLPVCLSEAGTDVRTLLEPLIVGRWNSAGIMEKGALRSIDTEICLISLDQLACEIEERIPQDWKAQSLSPGDPAWNAAQVTETRHALYPDRVELNYDVTHRIIDLGQDRSLSHPILLDASVAIGSQSLVQYFPLGGRLVLVRSVRAPTTHPEPNPKSLHLDMDKNHRCLSEHHFIEKISGSVQEAETHNFSHNNDYQHLSKDSISMLIPSSVFQAAMWAIKKMAFSGEPSDASS